MGTCPICGGFAMHKICASCKYKAEQRAAAKATLDKLRRVFPPLMAIDRANRLYVNDAIRATHILYPQPKETTDVHD